MLMKSLDDSNNFVWTFLLMWNRFIFVRKHYIWPIIDLVTNPVFGFSMFTSIAMAMGILVICLTSPKPKGMSFLFSILCYYASRYFVKKGVCVHIFNSFLWRIVHSKMLWWLSPLSLCSVEKFVKIIYLKRDTSLLFKTTRNRFRWFFHEGQKDKHK
jgi:hypothetical protein